MGTAHQATTDPDLQRYQQPHTTSTTAGGEENSSEHHAGREAAHAPTLSPGAPGV